MNDGPLLLDEFRALMTPYAAMLGDGDGGRDAVAVAVSGGADSMALVWLLSHMLPVTALTVDHGLRAGSAAEALQVGQWLRAFDAPQSGNITHHILTRDMRDKRPGKIQEMARNDRYRMMVDFCNKHHLGVLCVAHHLDDQAETVLFRLAKGSGLDGLCAMQPLQYRNGVALLRPILGISKGRLLASCKEYGIPFVEDPSNENDDFARVRLRQSMDVLAKEGLTARRLGVTAKRLGRARSALDYYAQRFWDEDSHVVEAGIVNFDSAGFLALPPEISLRCLLQAYRHLLGDDFGYGPRMERLEVLHERILHDPSFNAATLGGCIVRFDVAKKRIVVELERKGATLNQDNFS